MREDEKNVGDLDLIPGLGRSPGEGSGNPLQYACLENPMDRGYSPWGCKELDTTERLTLWVLHTRYFTLEENDQEAEFKPSSDWLQRKRKLFPQIRCERKKKEQWSMEIFKLKDWREQKGRSLDSLGDSLCEAQTMFLAFQPPSIVLRVDCLVAKLTLC